MPTRIGAPGPVALFVAHVVVARTKVRQRKSLGTVTSRIVARQRGGVKAGTDDLAEVDGRARS
jgi:hypothetical protein